METKNSFQAIRKALADVGSNFDYLFDVLTSLNSGLEREAKGQKVKANT